MLGMKGASTEAASIWKIRLQLMKPITWIPLMWGVVCGAASSGEYTWSIENVLKAALCMLMSGPLLTGYTQVVNEWYDREIDAVNEPYRPIPSGAISGSQVVVQIIRAVNWWDWGGIYSRSSCKSRFPNYDLFGDRRCLRRVYLFGSTIEIKAKWLVGYLCSGRKLYRLTLVGGSCFIWDAKLDARLC